MSASRAVRAPDISRIALVDEKGCDTFRSLFLIAKPNSKIACRLVRKIDRCRANMHVLAHIAHCDAQNRERRGGHSRRPASLKSAGASANPPFSARVGAF